MKELTFKTIFLTALATGKRRSELHALIRRGLSWSDDKANITLRVAPEFVSFKQGFHREISLPLAGLRKLLFYVIFWLMTKISS